MCLSFLITGTGTGTVRWRAEGAGRSWLAKRAEPGTHVPTTHTDGAEGAALGSQSEPSTSYHVPVPVYTATTAVQTGFWNPDDC